MRQYQIIFQAMQKTLPVLAENVDGHRLQNKGLTHKITQVELC